jgi:hypothetical protein
MPPAPPAAFVPALSAFVTLNQPKSLGQTGYSPNVATEKRGSDQGIASQRDGRASDSGSVGGRGVFGATALKTDTPPTSA